MATSYIYFVLVVSVFCLIQNTIAQSIGISNGCGNTNGFIGNGLNGININNGLNNIGFGAGNIGANIGNIGANIGNFGFNSANNIANVVTAADGGTNSVGYGEVAVIGELPVGGQTAVTGNVPVIGYVTFEGTVPAGGLVSVAAGCGCNGELVNYLA